MSGLVLDGTRRSWGGFARRREQSWERMNGFDPELKLRPAGKQSKGRARVLFIVLLPG